MRYIAGLPTPQAGEVDEALWAPLDDLPGMLTHVNERRLIEVANKIIAEKTPAEFGF
jgi:hypothetical protein